MCFGQLILHGMVERQGAWHRMDSGVTGGESGCLDVQLSVVGF